MHPNGDLTPLSINLLYEDIMNKTQIRAYTKALVESASHRAVALEIELAVGLAVMHECAPSKRLGRETLLTIYYAAGWQCDKPGSIDWRAVNRRITASIALYDFMPDDVAQLAESSKGVELVDAIRPMIKALKVKSINEVLLATDRVRPPRKPAHHEQEGQRINVGHLHLIVPPTATRDELIALATQLMTLAASEPFVIPAKVIEHAPEQDKVTA
jgi:hypothetical protein